MADIKKEVEAILFSAGRAVLLAEFQSLLGMRNPGLIKDTIRELTEEYITRDSPLMIMPEGEGWKLTVKEKFLPTVQRINPHTELSKTVLETLAVISWKQPVLQSAVIKIRTNKAYDHIAELENLGFVTREKHGRSFLIKVTEKFLDYFDLPSAKEIKAVFKDFRDIEVAVQKKAEELGKERQQDAGQPAVQEGGQQATKGGQGEQGSVAVKEVLPGGIETFSDTLPEMKVPKHGTELEVYERPPEKPKLPDQPGPAKSAVGKKESFEQKRVEETPEEKTRRIARELLGEELNLHRQEESVEERKLHPKLEEFIAGSSGQSRKKRQNEERPAVAAGSAVSRSGGERPQGKEDEDASGSDESKAAEEFPGQFSGHAEDEEEDK